MNILPLTQKAFWALAGLAVIGLFFAGVLFMVTWVDPHRHLYFIFPAHTAGEAWSMCWRTSFFLIGIVSLLNFLWYGGKRIFT